MTIRIVALLAALLAAAPAAASQLRLLMLDQAHCQWCDAWDAEIGHVYPKTAEGRAAPLLRTHLRAPPAEARLARPARFTPTFVLLRDGVEVGRIEGYPGQDFFWGLLGALLDKARDHRDAD